MVTDITSFDSRTRAVRLRSLLVSKLGPPGTWTEGHTLRSYFLIYIGYRHNVVAPMCGFVYSVDNLSTSGVCAVTTRRGGHRYAYTPPRWSLPQCPCTLLLRRPPAAHRDLGWCTNSCLTHGDRRNIGDAVSLLPCVVAHAINCLADNCAIVALVYPDAAIDLTYYDGELYLQGVSFPSRFIDLQEHSLGSLLGSSGGAGGIDSGYLHMTLTVPHITTLVVNIKLLDDNGVELMSIPVPEEQQTRYTMDGDTLHNTISIPLSGAGAGSGGNWNRVRFLMVDRNGDPELNGIAPEELPNMIWTVHSLFISRQCKACGASPSDSRREAAVVPLMNVDGSEVRLAETTTVFPAEDDHWLNLARLADPTCECLLPEHNAAFRFELYRGSSPNPNSFDIIDVNGVVLYSDAIDHVLQTIAWHEYVVPFEGQKNRWPRGEHPGQLPRWDKVKLRIHRTGGASEPEGAQPIVRNAYVRGTGDIGSAHALYLSHRHISLRTPWALNTTLVADGCLDSAFPERCDEWSDTQFEFPLEWRDITYLGDRVGDCFVSWPAADCGDLELQFDAKLAAIDLLDVMHNPVAADSLVFTDGGGNHAEIEIDSDAWGAVIAASPRDKWATVRVPLALAEARQGDEAFLWSNLASVRFIRSGGIISDADEAAIVATRFGLDVRGIVFGVPPRAGHLWDPLDNTDDLACGFAMRELSPFAPNGPNRYRHCIECCCYFDNPGNPDERYCYEQGDVIADVTPAPDMAPNDQCAVCNRGANPDVMTPRNGLYDPASEYYPAPCDDFEPCSHSDFCTDVGTCEAEIYTTCLIADFWGGDPSKDCEQCDGTGPDSPTKGCTAKEGFYVHAPGTNERSCGCLIDGVVWPHLAINPDWPCQKCDVTESRTEWSHIPDDSSCDITQQIGWENTAAQACTYFHICSRGVCGGQPYSCAALQACEAFHDDWPNVCDLSGPASETGGCQRVEREAGEICAPAVHGCISERRCNGIAGTCPPQSLFELAGIIYEDEGKAIDLLLPDGSPVDPEFPVVPSVDEVLAEYRNFRVQCDNLYVRMGLLQLDTIEDTSCSYDKLFIGGSNTDAWGSDFEPSPRGLSSVKASPALLLYSDGSKALTAATGVDDAVDSNLSVDGSDLSHLTVPSCQCVTDGAIDLEVKMLNTYRLTGGWLTDSAGANVTFTIGQAQPIGLWTTVTGTLADAKLQQESGFDWSSVAAISLTRAGGASVQGLSSGDSVAWIRGVVLRVRVAPPCPRVVVLPVSLGSEMSVTLPAPAAGDVEEMNIDLSAAPIDMSSVYEDRINAFEHVVVTFEVRVGGESIVGDAVVEAPTAVILRDAAGREAVVAVDTPRFIAAHSWQAFSVRLSTGSTPDPDFDAASVSEVSVVVGPMALVSPPHTVEIAVRNVVAEAAAPGTCQPYRSLSPPAALELFASPSPLQDVVLVPSESSRVLIDATSGASLISDRSFSTNLESLYDEDCDCFPDAILEVTVTHSSTVVLLDSIELLQASTERGLRIPLDWGDDGMRPGERVAARTRILASHFVSGGPEYWANINVLRFTRNAPEELPNEYHEPIVVHSIRIGNNDVPCNDVSDPLRYERDPHPSLRLRRRPATLVPSPRGEWLSDVTGTFAPHQARPSQHSAFEAFPVAGGSGTRADAVTGIAVLPGISISTLSVTEPLALHGAGRVRNVAGVSADAAGSPIAVVLASSGLDNVGDVQWAVSIEGTHADDPWAAASGAAASPVHPTVAVVGAVNTAGLGSEVNVFDARTSESLSSSNAEGAVDSFAMVLDKTGGVSWFKIFGSDADDTLDAVAFGSSSVVAVGSTYGTLAFDDSSGSYASTTTGFVSSFAASDGATEWVIGLGHAADATVVDPRAVVIDNHARIAVVAGTYSGGALSAGSYDLPAPTGDSFVFISAVDINSHTFLWLSQPLADEGENAFFGGLAMLSGGNVFVGVRDESDIAVAGSSSVVGLDASATGSVIWAETLGFSVSAMAAQGDAVTVAGALTGSTLTVEGTEYGSAASSAVQAVMLRLRLAGDASVEVSSVEVFGGLDDDAFVLPTFLSVCAPPTCGVPGEVSFVAGVAAPGVSFGGPEFATYSWGGGGDALRPFVARFEEETISFLFDARVESRTSGSASALYSDSASSVKSILAVGTAGGGSVVLADGRELSIPTGESAGVAALFGSSGGNAVLAADALQGMANSSFSDCTASEDGYGFFVAGTLYSESLVVSPEWMGAPVSPRQGVLRSDVQLRVLLRLDATSGRAEWLATSSGVVLDSDPGVGSSLDTVSAVAHAEATDEVLVSGTTWADITTSAASIGALTSHNALDGTHEWTETFTSLNATRDAVTLEAVVYADGAVFVSGISETDVLIPSCLPRSLCDEATDVMVEASGGGASAFVAAYAHNDATRQLVWWRQLSSEAGEVLSVSSATSAGSRLVLCGSATPGTYGLTNSSTAATSPSVVEDGGTDGWTLVLDAASGEGVWLQIFGDPASGGGHELGCSSAATTGATGTGALFVGLNVRGAAGVSLAEGGSVSIESGATLSADSAADMLVVALDPETGSRVADAQLFGSRARPGAELNPSPSQRKDVLSSVRYDAAQNRMLVAASTSGTLTWETSSGTAVLSPSGDLSGSQVPGSDATLLSFSANITAPADNPARATPACSHGRFVVGEDAGGDAIGVAAAAALGRTSLLVGGYFKGVLPLIPGATPGSGTINSPEAQPDDLSDAYDGFYAVYDAVDGQLKKGVSFTTVEGYSVADDKILGAASSFDGEALYVVGVTDSAVGTPGLSLLDDTAFGTSGRLDGFVGRIADRDGAVEWAAAVGAVSENDGLHDVATAGDTVVVVGNAQGRGVFANFDSFAVDVESRTIATTFAVDAATGATEIWASSFGTVETDGHASFHAVAMQVDGEQSYVAAGGVFWGGSLDASVAHDGSLVLDPNEDTHGGIFPAPTAFVVLLDGADGSVLWARATEPGVGTSTVRSLAFVPSGADTYLAIAGDFSVPLLMWTDGDEVVSGNWSSPVERSTSSNVTTGFVTTMEITTAEVRWAQIPSSASTVFATGVVEFRGALQVSWTSTGPAVWGGAHRMSDAAAPSMMRGAVTELRASDGTVLHFEGLGGGGAAHAAVHAIAADAAGSRVAAAGLRVGNVGFLNSAGPSARDMFEQETQEAGVSAARQLHVPFAAVFDATVADPAMLRAVSSLQRVALRETEEYDTALQHRVVGVAPMQNTMLIAARTTEHFVHAPSTNPVESEQSGAQLVGVDRRTGSHKWRATISSGDGVHAVSASVDGRVSCVVGYVFSNNTAEEGVPFVSMFGKTLDIPVLAGRDGFVACFEDASDSSASTAAWVQPIVASHAREEATAVHVTPDHVVVAGTTTGRPSIGDVSLANADAEVPSWKRPEKCWVAIFRRYDGALAHAETFGDSADFHRCVPRAIHSQGVSAVWIGGHFFGASPTDPDTDVAEAYGRPFLSRFDAARGVFSSHIQLDLNATSSIVVGEANQGGTAVGGSVEELASAPDGSLFASLTVRAQGLVSTADAVSVRMRSADNQAIAVVKIIDAASPVAADAYVGWATALSSSNFDVVLGGLAHRDGGLHALVSSMSTIYGATGDFALAARPRTWTPKRASSRARSPAFGAIVQIDPGTGAAVGFEALESTPPAHGSDIGLGGRGALATVGTFPFQQVVAVGTFSHSVQATSTVSALHNSEPTNSTLWVATLSPIPDGKAASAIATDTLNAEHLFESAEENDGKGCGCVPDAYVLMLDVWVGNLEHPLAGGEWRRDRSGGPGFSFYVPESAVLHRGAWTSLELPVHVHGELGDSYVGSDLAELGFFALRRRTRGLVVPSISTLDMPATVYRIRNAMLLRRGIECTPCGAIDVSRAVTDVAADDETGDLGLVAGESINILANSAPVDLSTIVDHSCECLDGSVLTVEVSPASSASELASLVFATHHEELSGPRLTVPLDGDSAAIFAAGGDWARIEATVALHDHVDASDVDWRFIRHVHLERAATASSDLAVSVRRIVISRDCPMTQLTAHPSPTLESSVMSISRDGLGMTRGNFYRVITYETNVYGDDSTQTCSPVFVADDTPPDGSGAVATDVDPSIGADTDVEIDMTKHDVLKVGWTGGFVEDDSAPTNLLTFYVGGVTTDSGVEVEGVLSDKLELAVTQGGFVETQPGHPPLVDGTTYTPRLFACNLGLLCAELETDGVLVDASPPTPTGPLLDVIGTEVSVEVNYTTDTSTLKAVWTGWEEPHGSGLAELRVGVGIDGFTTGVHELAVHDLNGPTELVFTADSSYQEGVPHYVVFRVTNGAGAFGDYRTDGVTFDTSAPTSTYSIVVAASIADGDEDYYTSNDSEGRVEYHSGRDVIRAKFKCEDPQSVDGGLGVMTYEWRACTDDSDCANSLIFSDWAPTGAEGTEPYATSDAAPDPFLTGGTEIYVEMRCTNPVGLQATLMSLATTVDYSPPIADNAFVNDLNPTDESGSTDDVAVHGSPTLKFTWGGFTVEEGALPITRYAYKIEASGTGDLLVDWTTANLATTAETTEEQASLFAGETYIVTIRATTQSGASAEIAGNGVLVDFTPPVDGVVRSAVPNVADACPGRTCVADAWGDDEDVTAVAQTGAMSWVFSGASDPETGVADILWGVGTCDAPFDYVASGGLTATGDPDASEFHATFGTPLAHGVEYCAVMWAVNTAGAMAPFLSNGTIVDLTAPAVEFAHDGSAYDDEMDYWADADGVSVAYMCTDPESGILRVEAAIIQTDQFDSQTQVGLADDGTVDADGLGTVEITADSPMEAGMSYHVRVSCINAAGVVQIVDTDGFVLDLTPPDSSGAEISHDHSYGRSSGVGGLGVDYSSDRTSIRASWRGFSDAQSGVAGFRWAVGTTPGDDDVVPQTDLGAATLAEATGLDLIDGETYYVTVFAVSRVGRTASTVSSGVTIDSTAPTNGPVLISTNPGDGYSDAETTGYTRNTTSLEVTWEDISDSDSEVSYRWAIGTSEYGEQVQPYIDNGAATSALATGLRLSAGGDYYVSVIAVNMAGLQVVSTSQRVFVDPFSPVAGNVYDGIDASSPYVAQTSTSMLSCHWSGFSDSLSSIALYRVGFGTMPGAADAASFRTEQASASSHERTGLSLTLGERYYCVVRAVDYAGNAIQASSHGIVVDGTPPIAGTVVDSGGDSFTVGATDIDLQVATTVASIHWSGWHDPESSIAAFEWKLGTTEGGDEVFGGDSVAGHLSVARRAGLSLTPGTRYYATLTAFNVLGDSTSVTTDGFTILDTTSETALSVAVSVGFIPVSTHITSGEDTDGAVCGCSDPNAAFDPVAVTCSCLPGFQLDVDLRQCVACGTGTCKHSISNVDQCTVEACSSDDSDETVSLPPDSSGMSQCGDQLGVSPDGAVRPVVNDATGNCECPPGSFSTLLDTDGSARTCQRCDNGWFAPDFSSEACTPCWAAASPDTVAVVTWDSAAVAATDATAVVVSIGLTTSSRRWTQMFDTGADPPASSAVFSASTGPASSPRFSQGMAVHACVSVMTGFVLGVEECSSPEPAMIDYSPPLRGVVSDGRTLADIDATSDTSMMAATWDSFVDAETGIERYEITFGTSPGSTDVASSVDSTTPWHQVPNLETRFLWSADSDGLVPDGTFVYATVRAWNGAGVSTVVSSDGVLVSGENPSGTVSIRGDNADALDFTPFPHRHASSQMSLTDITVSWLFGNQVRGFYSFEWALVDVDTDEVVYGWEAVGSRTTVRVVGDLELDRGHTYAARVRATSRAGLTGEAESPPTLVDDSIPIDGAVETHSFQPTFVERTAEGPDGQVYQADGSTISASWSFTDEETDIVRARVAVGSVVGGDQALAITEFDTDGEGEAEFDDLPLSHGQCYVVQVSAINAAGLESTVSVSNQLCVDSSLPRVSVNVGSASGDGAAAQISLEGEFGEAWAEANITDALFVDDVAVFAQAQRSALSDGGMVFRYALDGDVLVSGVAVDAESALSGLSIGLSTSPDPSVDEAFLGEGWTDVDVAVALDQNVGTFSGFVAGLSFSGESVPRGTELFAHAVAYNGAGEAEVSEDPVAVVFDSTAPEDLEIDVAAFQSSTTSIDIAWSANEFESELLGFAWTITQLNATIINATALDIEEDEAALIEVLPIEVVSATWAGISSSVTVEGLELEEGAAYHIGVVACNVVGLCNGDSATVVIDRSPPVAGIVHIGDTLNSTLVDIAAANAAFVAELLQETALPLHVADPAGASVTWGGFADDTSGISGYTVGIGTTPNGTQLGGPLGLGPGESTLLLSELLGPGAADYAASLTTGQLLYVTVAAANGVGVVRGVSMPLFFVDSMPPLPAAVSLNTTRAATILSGSAGILDDFDADGGNLARAAALAWRVAGAGESLHIQWAPFVDDVGVVAHTVRLVDMITGETVVEADVGGDVVDHTFEGVATVSGGEYRASVTAVDVVGRAVTAYSPVPLIADSTPPVLTGAVRDGVVVGEDLDCIRRAGVDPDLEAAPLHVTPDAEPLLVPQPEQSDPTLPPVEVEGRFSHTTVIGVHFPPFVDAESGVRTTQVAVGGAPGATDVVEWVDVPEKGTELYIALPPQPEGTLLFTSARACNGLGLCSDAFSADGVRVLCTPGDPGCAFDGLFLCFSGHTSAASASD